jgi:hypothetical protein
MVRSPWVKFVDIEEAVEFLAKTDSENVRAALTAGNTRRENASIESHWRKISGQLTNIEVYFWILTTMLSLLYALRAAASRHSAPQFSGLRLKYLQAFRGQISPLHTAFKASPGTTTRKPLRPSCLLRSLYSSRPVLTQPQKPKATELPILPPPSVSRWLMLSSVLVFGVIVVGGVTRLTESGLSITEWRPITGILPPLTHKEWMVEFEKYRATPEFKL